MGVGLADILAVSCLVLGSWVHSRLEYLARQVCGVLFARCGASVERGVAPVIRLPSVPTLESGIVT